MEESNEPSSKKRNFSSNSDLQAQTGPAGHSLFDSLKLGGEGDRLPVEMIQVSNDSNTNENTKVNYLPEIMSNTPGQSREM